MNLRTMATSPLFMNRVWQLNINNRILEWKELAPLNQNWYVMGSAVFRDALVVDGGSKNRFDLAS